MTPNPPAPNALSIQRATTVIHLPSSGGDREEIRYEKLMNRWPEHNIAGWLAKERLLQAPVDEERAMGLQEVTEEGHRKRGRAKGKECRLRDYSVRAR